MKWFFFLIKREVTGEGDFYLLCSLEIFDYFSQFCYVFDARTLLRGVENTFQVFK